MCTGSEELILDMCGSSNTICMYVNKDSLIINKRDIFDDEFRSWTIPIKYKIESPLTKNTIQEALAEISKNTCIEFNEDNSLTDNTQGIVFKKSGHCSSEVGLMYSNRTQSIQLTEDCSKRKGVILHEVGHALGLVHEHSRKDRDKYVTFTENYVKSGEDVNFRINNNTEFTNFSTYYDYNSIMHYGPYDFTNNPWKKVLTSNLHKEYDRMMGQRSYMTFNDYKKINKAHCDKCRKNKRKNKAKDKKKIKKKDEAKNNKKDKTKNNNKSECKKIKCFNGGYQRFNDSENCFCPTGYTGKACENINKSDDSCGSTNFQVTDKIQYYAMSGNRKCYIFLLADEKKKINIGIYYTYAKSKTICTEDVSHQIKYLADKGTTGLLLCSWRRDVINITSELNSALIIYNGQDSNHFLHFGFKQVDEVSKV
uniref:Metalloendopeptidase n=1 Tax=Strongyloides papillosus TaxID=174720 RepID=A0A0N5BTW6_STREA